ncbi:MAG: hypothetical protein GY754_05655 [bacterium]|nr:hypothetical protein [bacterium]
MLIRLLQLAVIIAFIYIIVKLFRFFFIIGRAVGSNQEDSPNVDDTRDERKTAFEKKSDRKKGSVIELDKDQYKVE